MPLALSIRPCSDTLNLYGDVDSSLTFSLSGHVSVSVTSPLSLLSRRRTTARILLHSLTITFEGQSETLSPATGYASIRLCSITRELLPGGPLDLSNEGHEDSDKPCLWNIIFDIPVPGWLPTTSVHGDASLRAAGTSYALYATATFVNLDHGHSSFSFAKICGPVRPHAHTVDAHRFPVILRRFVEPQAESSSMFQMSVFIVDACRAADPDNPFQSSIPKDVLEKVQVVASIPSATAMSEASIPLVLRIRGKGLNDSERTQLRITGFSVDIEQVEIYRNNSDRGDVNQYPIPSPTYQPPRVPLRNPHPVHALYDTGFLGSFTPTVKRSFSILASTDSGRYIISGGGHIFAQDNSVAEDSWYILETKIPMLAVPYLRDWAGPQKRRVTESSPLFSVEHHMHVVVHCEYDLADSGEAILERLHFSLPMRHVNVLESMVPSRTPTESRAQDTRKNLPYSQSLPAYSQLFHPNGERKVDYSIPLPVYEPLPVLSLG